ncbi:Cyclic di-GMP phosphodiesterase response regulator RpfG [Burkholderiales bacterium]|nr:Cyclic di-GMP phosphodiesterase response regulator RpfG [Burkholderiales bacterium]
MSATQEMPFTLLCVDDEANILSALRRLFRPAGYRVLIAGGGDEGLSVLAQETVDLVISDMRMPGMDGAAFLEKVRERWPGMVRILLTGYADVNSTIAAINRGEIYRYIAKPWEDAEVLQIVASALEKKQLEREKARLEGLLQKQNEQLKELNQGLEAKVAERTAELQQTMSFLEDANERLKTGFLTSVKVFSNLIELRRGAFAGHSRRVAELAKKLATALGVERSATQDIMLAGLLHEVGKIGLPDSLLSKALVQMSTDEQTEFRKFPANGQVALMALEQLREAAKLLRAHQERWDGTGYPDGLAGEATPLGARILAVVNDFDELQMGTLKSSKLTPEEAKAYLLQYRGKRYDPKVVEAFLKLLGGGPEPEAPSRETVVSAKDLSPGMVLARDLISRHGVLLLAADYMLEDSLIRQIRDYENADGMPLVIHVRRR